SEATSYSRLPDNPGPRADGPLVFAEAPRGCFIFTDCFSSPTRTEPPPSEHESGAGDHGSPTARAQTTLHCRLENALVPLMVKQRHAPGYRIIPAFGKTAPSRMRKHPGGASYSQAFRRRQRSPSPRPPSAQGGCTARHLARRCAEPPTTPRPPTTAAVRPPSDRERIPPAG